MSNGSQLFVEEYQQAAIEGFTQEFKMKFFLDRNLNGGVDVDGNTVDSTNVSETMGVIPALQRAVTVTGMNLVVDHSACCDPADADAGNTAMIASFFANIRAAWRSGLYPNKVVTVVGNQKFEEAILNLQAAIQNVNGVQVHYVTNGEEGYKVTQSLPILNLGGITVQFEYDDSLDDLYADEGFYLIVPKEQIYFYQRAFGFMDNNMKVTNEINGYIESGYPWLRFIDISEDIDKFGRCRKYISDFEYAIALGGTELGGWRAGRKFESCVAACDICNDATTVGAPLI